MNSTYKLQVHFKKILSDTKEAHSMRFHARSHRSLRKALVMAFISIFVSFSISLAANHYVDRDASGQNNGSSWSNAWESFGDINWNSIYPGDVIYISGGSTSKSYSSQQLNIGTSGTSSNPIIITKGASTGHDGTVIIDGNSNIGNLIDIDGVNYINVSGFQLQQSSSGGHCINIDAANHVTVSDMNIVIQNRAGVFIQESSYITVKNCYMETLSYVGTQTDGIYSQRNDNCDFNTNTIIINNTETSGHDDCIQMYDDKSMTVRNNFLKQNNSKKSNAQGLYSTTMHGTSYYYNNVINLTNAESNCLAFRRLPSLGGDGTVRIYSNSIYGVNPDHTIWVTETDNHIVKNNFAYAQDGLGMTISTGGTVSNNFTNNPHYVSISNDNFHLQSDSGAIDRGTTLGSPYNIDIEGNPRPQGSGYDIGAYEIGDGATSEPLPVPQNLHIAQ